MQTAMQKVIVNTPPFKSPDLAVLPIFNFYHAICLSPLKLTFNVRTNQYECIPSGWLRKVVCFFFHLCIQLNTLFNYGDDINRFASGTVNLLTKIAYLGYFAWTLAFHYVMWMKLNQVAEIFNLFIEFEQKCENMKWSILTSQRKWTVKDSTMTKILICSVLIISTMENLNGIKRISDGINLDHGTTVTENVLLPIKKCGIFALHSLSISQKKITTIQENSTENPATLYISGCLFVLTNALRGICFTFMDLLVACWGFQFRKLILMVNQQYNSNNNKGQPLRLPPQKKAQIVLMYIKFTTILERFNEVLGILVITGLVSEILYVSTRSTSFAVGIETKDGTNMLEFIAVFFSFIPFVLSVLVPSEVHQLARKFACLLKMDSIHELEENGLEVPSNKINCPGAYRVSEALPYIQYDLAVNSVGFQGLGFFTLSYGFLGSIVTAITTYSLVILQFYDKPHNLDASN